MSSPTAPVCRWPSRSAPRTPTTSWPSPRSYERSQRSDPGVDRAAAARRRSTPTKGYDFDDLRRFCRDRGIVPRIARRGIETSAKLGRHRWVIESTIAWLFGRRRLTARYERKASLFGAFLSLAATLTSPRQMRHALTTSCVVRPWASGARPRTVGRSVRCGWLWWCGWRWCVSDG